MSHGFVRRLLLAGLLLAVLLHNDLWLWDDARIVWGLPSGLTYHVLFCIAVSILMGLLVRLAWPFESDQAASPPESVASACKEGEGAGR